MANLVVVISCGDVLVHPGELVLSGYDGVVVVLLRIVLRIILAVNASIRWQSFRLLCHCLTDKDC
ncbi:hypothetical protein ACFLV3_01190 [Chloroflexota bacterium]